MESRLNLKLNGLVIKRAKVYAKTRRTTLSFLIETYLQKLIKENTDRPEVTPLVKSLSGIVSEEETLNIREGYAGHLNNKCK